MDFDDTPEEAAFRAEARAWLAANAAPRAYDESPETPLGERADAETVRAAQAWQAKKFDTGFACITWPREYGGRGSTPIQNVIWHQEEARFRTPPNLFLIGIGMAGPTFLVHGSEEQKRRYLPAMARGDEIWCQLFSEPGAGSDLAGLRTSAVRDGEHWIVNGQKIWTTGAQYCDFGILVARTDPDLPKHAGLTYFIVDMNAPGIEVRPIQQINGGTGFNEVFFSDVNVPDHNRVGAVGNGWAVAIATLMNERASTSNLGGVRYLPRLFELCSELPLGAGSALQNPAVRQRLADFTVRGMGLRTTGYRILTALSHGGIPGPEASLGKLAGARLAQEMADFALELQGSAGMTLGAPETPQQSEWQELCLLMPGLRIAGGTDEILRTIIAERVLRLPPEPRPDKDIAFREVPMGPTNR